MARFFTHGLQEEGEKGTLGPVIVWIGVKPGLTSVDTAHNASQEILALLQKNGVEDVEVEWREAVLQKLAGPLLMEDFTLPHISHVDSTWTPGGFPEFMWSLDHFSLNGSPANPLSRIHAGVQLLHLDNMDSTSEHREI